MICVYFPFLGMYIYISWNMKKYINTGYSYDTGVTDHYWFSKERIQLSAFSLSSLIESVANTELGGEKQDWVTPLTHLNVYVNLNFVKAIQ